MKKILILFSGILLTWNVVFAQAPTLNFKMINPRIEQIRSGTGTTPIYNYFCFDVQVSASAGGTYFDAIQLVFTFNTTGLDASATSYRKFTKGPLALGDDGSGNFFYNINSNWNAGTSRLFVGVLSDPAWANLQGSSDYMNEITTSFQTLVTVRIYIPDRTQIANLVFVQASMNGVSTYRNTSGSAPFTSSYYSSPYTYGAHDLANAYLGRIHNSSNTTPVGGWSQSAAVPAVIGTGWKDWTVSENTTVWDGNGHILNANSLVTALKVETTGVLTIDPDKSVTATGPSHFEDPHSLVIAADATGVGSFIDNGAITYGTTGSADVQTWINNAAGATNFHFHQVGPTVMDPSYSGPPGISGVYLGAFNLPSSTYAYLFDEPTALWQNISATNTKVPTATGMILSTANNTPYTLTMTGQIVNVPVTTAAPVMRHSNANLELISNPYSAAVDFNVLYAANQANIGTNMYIWIHGLAGTPQNPAGNYGTYSTISGSTNGVTKDIQVGQGFFVETLQANPFIFNPTNRLHSTNPFFKESYIDRLLVRANGNDFSDEAIIHFYEGASSEYTQNQDAYKWSSAIPEATEIWSVANDQSLLSINALPALENNMVSVPVNFKCSAEGTYTFTAEDIQSFETGAEIYLEDLVTGASWHDLILNPVYEFTSTPSSDYNRFILHFFGPTGIDNPGASGLVKIYGYGQDAYIVNRGNETIKEYVAYDMMGRELHRGTLPNNTVNKVTIGNVSAYYIVKVITREGTVYTDKVYISK